MPTEPKKFKLTPGTLYIVATPIGNMGDITLRAIAVLSQVDFILSEDTRSAGRLMKRLGLKRELESYQKFSEAEKIKRVIARLKTKMTCALISESGTPLISDPGARLIRACVDEEINIDSIPGPSAVINALVLSGFLENGFYFAGFLPRKKSEREAELLRVANIALPVVIYESPKRVAETLAELSRLHPERNVALIREMTKLHQQVIRGTCRSLAADLDGTELKGECVIVLTPSEKTHRFDTEKTDMIYNHFKLLKREGIPPGRAAKITAKLLGLDAKELYKILACEDEE